MDRSRYPRGDLQRPKGGRQEVLIGVTGSEHEPTQPLGVMCGDELTEGATGVVTDERDALELELLEEVRDDPREPERRQVGAVSERGLM